MTPARGAAFALAVFFATGAVALWAGTLWPPTPFLAGLGWAWVLWRIDEWWRAA